MGKLKIAGIGLAVFAGIFLVLIGIGVVYSANPSDSHLQNKIDVLEVDKDKIEKENAKLKNQSDLEDKISSLKIENNQLQNQITTIEESKTDTRSEPEFDPILIQSAKKNIPEFQNLAKAITKECRNVDSYMAYLAFSVALTQTDTGYGDGSMTNLVEDTGAMLSILELLGYDEHPEIGKMIKETRSLYLESSECIEQLVLEYES